jgi:hypothetical protein
MTKAKPKGGRPPHKLPATVADLRRMSRAQVVRSLNIPPATLDGWRRAGLPEDRGRFDVAAIVAWLREQWRQERAANAAQPSPQLERLRAARADSAELARDEARARLVDRAEVVALASVAITGCRSRLLGLIKRVASRLGGFFPNGHAIVEAELEAEVYDALRSLAAGMDRMPGSDGAASATLAAATPSTTPPAPPAAATDPDAGREVADLASVEHENEPPATSAGITENDTETNA